MPDHDPHEPLDILLVEGTPGDVHLITEAFENSRLANDVAVVRTAPEALEYIHGRVESDERRQPDLALIETGLPDSDVASLLATLDNDPAVRDLPVILLKGSRAKRKAIERANQSGYPCMEKPLDPDEFLDVVRRETGCWIKLVHGQPDDVASVSGEAAADSG